ncbi:MAG: hypothetical protein QN135_02380 [Armatimonadota bacterium]|nr:hypothetical protein [Armatimonadota bacterium]
MSEGRSAASVRADRAAVRDAARTAGPTALVLGLVAVVLAGVWTLFLKYESHWSVDSAIRELMIKRVAEGGLAGLTVPNLAAEVDPEGRFFPRFFFVGREDGYRFAFQPLIAVLGAVPYGLLGRAGLPAIPLLGALALGWVTALGAQRIRPESAAPAAALLLLATPVALYAVTLWDHLPSVAMLTGGTYLIWRHGLESAPRLGEVAAGGFLIGAALLFRNEAYAYGLAVAVAWVVSAPRAKASGLVALVVGFAAGWALNAGWNRVVFGDPFGPKAVAVAAQQVGALRDPEIGGFVTSRLWKLYLFVIAPDFQQRATVDVLAGMAAFATIALAAGLLSTRHPERRLGPVAASLWLVALATIWVLGARGQVTGFFWVAPYLVMAFVYRPASPLRRFLWVVGLVFAALVIGTASQGGYQWGPRYLLAVYPIALWLALDGWFAASDGFRRGVRVPVTVLVVLAGLAQAAGVDHADTGAWQGSAVVQALRTARTEYVATGVEGFAWFFAPYYGEKKILAVDSAEELRDLVHMLLRARLERFTYVPRDALFDPRIIERENSSGVSYRRVDDRNHLGMRLIEYRLDRTP